MPSEANGLLWIAALGCALLAGGVYLLWRLLARIRELEAQLRPLSSLEPAARAVERLAQVERDLDLRRIEHVLIDLRDGQRRTEDRLLSLLEGGRAGAMGGTHALSVGGPAELQERILTRLLALGYERIVFVTPSNEISALPGGDGPVQVEARRDGVVCKGRVILRGGAIHDVQLQSAFAAFP